MFKKYTLKTSGLAGVLLMGLAISSCQLNQSVNNDLTTGEYTRGDGITSDKVVIINSGKSEKKNTFFYGEEVQFLFNNVLGLTEVNNKTYPGLSLHIIKNEKDTVLSQKDLFKDLNEGTDLSPLQLNASFRAALPYKEEESYKLFIEIWDKKGEGKYNYELPFSVVENNLLDIKSKGITYSNIYLWDETTKQPVLEENIASDHLTILILDGVEGFELKNEKIFPVFSLVMTDSKGNKILSSPNLLSEYETEGINPENVKQQLTAQITFTEGVFNNPCSLIATLTDLNSEKKIEMTTTLNIE